MIIGEPTMGAVAESLEAEGCPTCGAIPAWIDIDGPGRLVPSCGHSHGITKKIGQQTSFKSRTYERCTEGLPKCENASE